MRTASILLSALLISTVAPAPKAQLLDGEWFKVTASFAGTGLNNATNEAEAGHIGKITCYAHFTLLPLEGAEGPTYSLSVTAINTDGDWVDASSGGTIEMLDEAETYVQHGEIGFPTKPIVPIVDGAPNIASVEFNGPAKVKGNEAILKSAKITSLGATSYFTNDAFAFYGKAKLTLTRVAPEKLPFEVALLDTEPANAPKPAVPVPASSTPTAETATEAKPQKP